LVNVLLQLVAGEEEELLRGQGQWSTSFSHFHNGQLKDILRTSHDSTWMRCSTRCVSGAKAKFGTCWLCGSKCGDLDTLCKRQYSGQGNKLSQEEQDWFMVWLKENAIHPH
jgi:hypothetical protein